VIITALQDAESATDSPEVFHYHPRDSRPSS
jgi:hypothetical protein